MGHSSKFIFPLPGRKSKPAPAAPSSGPWTTKAQKILGSADLHNDRLARPTWEAQSNSGISIAVTETTAGELGHARTQDGWVAPKALGDRRWEQESEIIPAALNRHDTVGALVPDGATDASSLRRRQSSSTITSYYDKANLPLSISQQTSNSAMAKGLPTKAHALLDIDGEFTEAPPKPKKKPSRLDLSALLQKHRSSKHLDQDGNKHQRKPDMATKHTSSMFVPPAPVPLPMPQRTPQGVRTRATMESLREHPTQHPTPQAPPYGSARRLSSGQEQPTKASVDLHNLYDHYEQRTFADAMDQEFQAGEFYVEPPSARRPPSYPPPPPGQSGKAYLSPFPSNSTRSVHPSKQSPVALTAAELRRAGAGTPSSPVPADCASVSSRHTRTSKASKRTDRSLQEIDLLQNSVLALSSDSEDDYELSSKGSLAVPPLSDGQASPTSPRSPISQTSMGPYDAGRGKPVKRASFAPNAQTFPPSQAPPAPKAPKISPRTSSLNSKASAASGHALAHETSRLSFGTNSTERTVPHVPNPATGAQKALKKMRSESQFDFPAPPVHRGSRSASVSRVSEQSHSASPTSVDLYLQSHRSPASQDGASIRSGASHSSAANGGRRGSAASSIHDSNSGRFMAVTRQEEMLLAALRLKRARMREDIIAEFEDEVDRDEHNPLTREVTNESMAGSMSRQSSRSTMRQEAGTLSARPRHQAQARPTPNEKGESLRIVVERSSYDTLSRTPGSEISDFIHIDDSFSSHGPGGLERKDSKASSMSSHSQRSASSRQRASLSPMTAPAPRRSQRRDASGSRRGPEQVSPKGQKDLPHQILEDPAEDDDDGIPRPDSPISPSDFPTPMSIKNNKQVRLSAVGFYKPSDAGW